MAINFLFWNIGGNQQVLPLLKKMIDIHNIHILLLAECGGINQLIIENLTGLNKVIVRTPKDENKDSPQFYTSLQQSGLEHISTESSLKRLLLCSLKLPNLPNEIIVGGIHFPSKLGRDKDSQESTSATHANFIREIEKERKHTSTILFGDFNMNPFESGMIKPEYFNATLSETIAKKDILGSSFGKNDFFYNPMWNFLGDKKLDNQGLRKPFSTYYFDNRTQDSTIVFYNILDGVIMRANLIDLFDFESLAIIDKINDISLVDDEFRPKKIYSDHLPIKFSLNI